MKAVFKHELSSYFTGMTAYVFAAFVLLFGGMYTMVYNLNALVTDFQYVVSAMSFVFLLFSLPSLEMSLRSWKLLFIQRNMQMSYTTTSFFWSSWYSSIVL